MVKIIRKYLAIDKKIRHNQYVTPMEDAFLKRFSMAACVFTAILNILFSTIIIVYNVKINNRMDRLTERIDSITEEVYCDSIDGEIQSAAVSTPDIRRLSVLILHISETIDMIIPSTAHHIATLIPRLLSFRSRSALSIFSIAYSQSFLSGASKARLFIWNCP